MKGFKKCYGVLFLLAIIFVLSLSVSSDSNALKYAYDAYPLYDSSFHLCDGDDCNGYTSHSSPGFDVYFDASSSLSYSSRLDEATFNRCTTLNSLQNIWSTQFSNSYHYFHFGTPMRKLVKSSPDFPDKCFNQATRWSYDHIYGASYNLSDGTATKLVSLPYSLFSLSDPSRANGSIKSLHVPLELDPSKFPVISSGTQLEWEFGLVQDDANNFPYVDPNTIVTLDISYHSLNPDTNSFSDFFNSWSSVSSSSNISGSPVCTIDFDYQFSTYNETQYIHRRGVGVHCSYTAQTDMYYVYPSITLRGSSGSSYNPSVFLTYDYHDVFFTGSYLITDGDDTWSGMIANSNPSGDDMDLNPSYNQLYGYDNPGGCVEGDFFCNLSNLFNFNFSNPFAPIFAMFDPGSNCAQIPTLAGMLHSEETEVCSFFSDNTRAVLTPVFTIASMMLIFGFTIRWLGARSGNFIEDSGGIDSGGYHFENKFRRKK